MTNNKKGFTLIELLVVIAIIGILSAIGLVSLNGAREKARDAQRKTDIATMRTALALYFDDHANAYPGAAVITGAPELASTTAGFYNKMVGTTLYLATLPSTTGAATACGLASNYYYASNNTFASTDLATGGHFALLAQLEGVGCKAAWIATDQAAGQVAESAVNSFGGAKCGAATDICASSLPASI